MKSKLHILTDVNSKRILIFRTGLLHFLGFPAFIKSFFLFAFNTQRCLFILILVLLLAIFPPCFLVKLIYNYPFFSSNDFPY